jgi:predicted transcriptional regulator
MAKKRNKLQVIYDILKVINEKKGQTRPTHILYKSNLSHSMMEEYLSELISKKFIIETKEGKSKTYVLAERGTEYLEKYKFIVEFSNSFGLID